jgi:hypothetical protein
VPRQLFQTCQALLEEALAPLADDLAGQVEALGDGMVTQALRRVEDDLGPDHIPIR